MMNRAGMVGVYGKIPTQADFFRANAGEFSQAGLDRWFEEALQNLLTEGGRLPDGTTGFLLAPRGGTTAFVGAFAPSRDGVGRSFPLVIFGEIEAAALAGALPSLPSAARSFVADAAALAVEGGNLSGPELIERARAMTLPSFEDGADVDVDPDANLAHEPVNPLVVALGGSPRALGYALRTMGLACDQASKYGPDAGAGVITVDAPTPTRVMARLWLKLVQRRLRWRQGLPSLLWTDPSLDSLGRMLVTLGPPSSAALAYLANPRHRSPRFWPLRTDVNVALDQAMQSLSSEQRRLIENPSACVGDLITAFAS